MSTEKQPINDSQKDQTLSESTEEALDVIASTNTDAPTEPINPLSLAGLPADVKWRIFKDQQLSYSDQWSLAKTCTGFYKVGLHDLMKQKTYDTGVVPLGMMEADIFKRYAPNYYAIPAIFMRDPEVFLELILDPEAEWCVVALMGLEDALIELLPGDKMSLVKDTKGHGVLSYLAAGNHVEVLKKIIPVYFANFNNDDLLPYMVAIVTGSEDVVRYFVNTFGFQFTIPGLIQDIELDETGISELHSILISGMKNLFWELVEAGADLNVGLSYPLLAATYNHWDVYDKLIARGLELTEEQRAIVTCYAAKYDHNRFLALLETCPNIDFTQFKISGNTVFDYACQGGQIATVDFLIEKAWFEVRFRRVKHGIHTAAEYGQFHLLDHFQKLTKGLIFVCRDENHKGVYYYVARHGNWRKYCALINMNASSYIGNLGKWIPEISDEDKRSDLNEAVKHGHLYFAQQFIRRFGDEYLLGRDALMEDAQASENPVMIEWVDKETKRALEMADQAEDLNQSMGI